MALRGVWQLKKLVVSYCDWGGSSRGIRAFMESELPAFKEGNPQLEVVSELNRGRHPFLKALYMVTFIPSHGFAHLRNKHANALLSSHLTFWKTACLAALFYVKLVLVQMCNLNVALSVLVQNNFLWVYGLNKSAFLCEW